MSSVTMSSMNIDQSLLKGPAFYKVMQRHVINLTIQELNSFPRPGAITKPVNLNTNLDGYVQTKEKPPLPGGDYGVYALDCEMCRTRVGNELTCITVVSSDCKIVYETMVKPDNPILDYNTRFSGISENNLKNVTTTLKDVQAFLLNLFSNKTIIIGHGLDADLRALRLIHDTVVDTSIVFPHVRDPPYKKALKKLVLDILGKDIQKEVDGHDSREDAIACMELMIWKVKHFLG